MSKIICSKCVMDSSVPGIEFDDVGQCNCCKDAIQRMPHEWYPNEAGDKYIESMVQRLKADGKGKAYDAMIGLSGGIDSAYLAHLLVKKYQLRVLAVHVDGGWNSVEAVSNIETIVRCLGIDLYTYVVEWQEMKDLQLAFLEASVLNQDIPQDHAFFATLYRTAKKFNIKYFLTGVNFASECIVPPMWGHPSMDGAHVKGIHKLFGVQELSSYPIMSLVEYLWLTRVKKQLTIYKPLNYMFYDKEAAQQELKKLYGWRDYGSKHSESRFTKFYQDIYLPKKFNFDKRKLHYSSLIVSGQISRDAALRELEIPVISEAQERRDVKFVAKKLGVTTEKMHSFISAEPVDHNSYPNGMLIHKILMGVRKIFRGLFK